MSRTHRRLIAGLELFGCVTVLLAALLGLLRFDLLRQVTTPAGAVALIVGSLMLGGLAGAAGWLLWVGHPRGRSLSLLLQALQCVGVVAGSLHLKIAAGPIVAVEIVPEGSRFSFGLGSSFQLFGAATPGFWSLTVNFVPVAVLILLLNSVPGSAAGAVTPPAADRAA